MPKMGESIIEATILNWVKQVGDVVETDDTILEIATDKVDSEVPSPVDGKIVEILHEPDSVVAVGSVIAVLETDAEAVVADSPATGSTTTEDAESSAASQQSSVQPDTPKETPGSVGAAAQSVKKEITAVTTAEGRFYSPLVRTMAAKEGIGQAELDSIPGSGKDGRVNKSDMLAYLKRRDNGFINGTHAQPAAAAPASTPSRPGPSLSGQDEIVAMDRMRKLIAKHMVDSKRTSPHVTSFIEADVTGIVNWRNRTKQRFQEQYGEKITFTPIFLEAVAKAIKDFPLVNVSVDGDNVIKRGNINIGMAAALPTGNLIVPVIKNADRLNLLGLTKAVNDLAGRARAGKLQPAETQDGTFTLTNVGTFGNVMGTPIINQPQAAILAVGAIRKKPAVLETDFGDVIAIRQMMFLSLSYDHRVVDGFLGGSFLRRIGDYLERFNDKRTDV